jgi:hypothetical protein
MTTPPLTPTPPIEPESRIGFRMRWKWFLTALAVLLAYLMWQCGTALYHGRELSNAAVQHFHKQLNDGDYQAILSEADPGFSSGRKMADLIKFFEVVHRKLGDAGAESLTNINVNAQTNGTFVTTVYTTTFARSTATETFTWKKYGSALKLYGYNINSNALILQ